VAETDHRIVWGFGRTTGFASQVDPRFSYWLHVPSCYKQGTPPRHRLMLVAVHGTDRNVPMLRTLFEEFSEKHGVLILAPHFPAGLGDPRDVDAYKYLRAFGVHYDEALLHIVGEVAARYGCNPEQFLLFGFSGGAHFAHRFWYLYPERLRALAVAAPGSVTLPTHHEEWWVGLGDVERRFGRPVDFKAMAGVPALLAVGSNDTAVDVISHSEDSIYWVKGANSAGRTRVDRLRTLRDALRARNIPVEYRELPGVAHEYSPLVAAAAHFFEKLIA
jgi:poly(3-hydroxybutyrate) depolymerase